MTTKNIYVIGYLNHGNLGDQQYKTTFDFIFRTYLPKSFLASCSINYIDCDKIAYKVFNDTDIIILGGGDVLNNYFLDSISKKFKGKPNKVLAVSVGVPYINLVIDTNKLQVIDYIFARSKQDIQMLKDFFSPERVCYLPDISIYLKNFPKVSIFNPVLDKKYFKVLDRLDTVKKSKKIICFSLSRHIRGNGLKINENYHNIIRSISNFVKYLLTFGYYIVFLPFNTNESRSGSHENDILIHDEVVELIKKSNPNQLSNITNIDFAIEPKMVLQIYDYFYATVPMRFHSVLFSIYKNVAMMPLFTTRKIKNLLLDINYKCSYYLDRDDSDLPVLIDDKVMITKFQELVSERSHFKDLLCNANRSIFPQALSSVFDTDFIGGPKNTLDLVSLIIGNYNKVNIVEGLSVSEKIVLKAYLKANEFANNNGYSSFVDISCAKLQDTVVKVISYILTNGTMNSVYNYGLKEKIFPKNPETVKGDLFPRFLPEWKWVINDHAHIKYSNTGLQDNPCGLFNINYIDQADYSGSHRSGWQYVYENITHLHNSKSDTYLDLYIDRTFHWNKEVNKFLNVIPYTNSWYGFVHHTFETEFSDYNSFKLLETPEFIDSLKVCKGLFVLSVDLKNKFLAEFKKKGICVPVLSFTHPTEQLVPQWEYLEFILNKDKKIMNIGGWLRNIFSFYYLTLPEKFSFTYRRSMWSKTNTVDCMRKVCLRGGNTSNYYPSLNFTNNLGRFLILEENNEFPVNPDPCSSISTNWPGNCSGNASQNVSCNPVLDDTKIKNNWYKHFYSYIKELVNSTGSLSHLTNEMYDSELTKNIVFINLVDASAVNTVIECICRATPIIVNKHPAVVEMLGCRYPLYFPDGLDLPSMNEAVNKLLANTDNIRKANIFLQNLDKTKYSIEYFVDDFAETIRGL